jgi:hypothetical protein
LRMIPRHFFAPHRHAYNFRHAGRIRPSRS